MSEISSAIMRDKSRSNDVSSDMRRESSRSNVLSLCVRDRDRLIAAGPAA